MNCNPHKPVLKASPYYLEDVLGLRLDERAEEGKISFLLLNQPPICDAHCRRCFMPEERRQLGKVKALGLKESQRVLTEAKKYGALCLEISGEGEPTFNRDLPELIGWADSLGYLTTLITNGHCLTEEQIEFYGKSNVTLVFSHFSLDKEKYEADSNVSGSFDKKMRNLEKAIDVYRGAIEQEKNFKIYRLAIHATIQRDNIQEVLDLRDYCREREIFFSIAPLAQTGCAVNHPEMELEDKVEIGGEIISLTDVPQLLGDNSIIHSHSSSRELGREVCGTCFYGLNIGYDGALLFDVHAGYEIGNLLGNVRTDSIAKLVKKQRKISKKLFDKINGFCPVRESGLDKLIMSFKKEEEIRDFYCEGGGMIASFSTLVGSSALVFNEYPLLGILGIFSILPLGLLGAQIGDSFGGYRFRKKYSQM